MTFYALELHYEENNALLDEADQMRTLGTIFAGIGGVAFAATLVLIPYSTPRRRRDGRASLGLGMSMGPGFSVPGRM